MGKIKDYGPYIGLLLATLMLASCGGGGGSSAVGVGGAASADLVGANNCSKCHTEQYDDWLDTPHAFSFVDLPDASQEDPVCLECHNTNHRRQMLEAVQCEACHGPGSLHNGLGPIKLSYQDKVCQDCHENDAIIGVPDADHDEVYQQWAESGHAEELAAAWHEFSDEAPPPGRHKSTYPIEMSNSSDGNFACFQCHNGIGALSYMKDIILTPAAITVEENATAECATCHNPHEHDATKTNALGDITTDHHVRLPEALSFNSSVPSVYRAFTFLDESDIPPRIGNGIICVFCHQGRSSGFILNTRRFGVGKTKSFENDHYLAAGAVLWGRNGYEYLNRSYTRDMGHNTAESEGCIGCHMENSNTGTEGGHTWKMVSDAGVENVPACNVAECHDGGAAGGPVIAFEDFNPNGVDYDGDTVVKGVAQEIGGINLDVDTGAPIDGLLGALVVAIETPGPFSPNGFKYLPTSYPYFYKVDGVTRPDSDDWTDESLAAAFNLNMIFKTVKQDSPLPAGGFKGAVNVHNPYYTIQLLVDSLQSLGFHTQTQLDNRPAGTSAASNYGANQLSLPLP